MGSRAGEGDGRGNWQARALSAEARAAQIESWLDVILETSPDPMGIVSVLENRYVRANDALAELYGISRDEILSCDPYSLALRLTHADDVVAEQKLFGEMVAGIRRFYRIEKRFVRPDGTHRWGLLTFSAIAGPAEVAEAAEGRLQFVALQVVDVTDRRALAATLARREEELRHAQKIDGIGRLAAGVAHDFNNLLTVIVGHGEMLKADAAEHGARPEVIDGLDAILAATERASDLTSQLLAYGRRETVRPRAFALSDAVRSLQRLLARTLPANIAVEQDLAAAGAIFADHGQVSQVVMNLVLNARDAMPDGGRLTLTTRDLEGREGQPGQAAPPPGAWVALTVADTGHGMSPEVQARMFEPFFTTRADRAGTQGTGLGLATVRRIVDDVGGHLTTKSAPGAGTTVTIFFPRAPAPPVPAAQAPEITVPASAPNRWHVLVVEDEPAVRALVANVLVGGFYRVTVARSAEEALRFIDDAAAPFDLIVTDLVMPGLGGAKLARHLEDRGKRPRLLFISGYSHHAPSDLSPYGDLLPKPFTPRQLLAAVERALR